jgi:type II secretory pathway pseudopilin PulG
VRRRRGGVLFEVIIAISLFVMAAITMLGAMSRAAAAVQRTRDEERAADLARSAIAMMEAGLASPESLNGPVSPAKAALGLAASEDALDSGSGAMTMAASEWELEIQTEQTEWDGLTRVSVRAIKRATGGTGERASYTLHQLVRLSEQAQDRAGEMDGISERAREAAPAPGGTP